MADRLMLIVPENADSMVSILDRYMKEWVSELSCIISYSLRSYIGQYQGSCLIVSYFRYKPNEPTQKS